MVPTTRALLETILAISISLFIAIKFQTLMHVAIGSILAPFLLLRSERSIEYGRSWFLDILKKIQESDTVFGTFNRVRIAFWAQIIRLLSTLRYPVDGFKSIPSNWYQIIFCIDTSAPAYILPGTMTVSDAFNEIELDTTKADLSLIGSLILFLVSAGLVYLSISNLGSNILLNFILIMLLILFLMMSLTFSSVLLCFIGSYAYRLSLKSTALLWLPLIYVSHTTFDDTLSLRAKIYEQKYSAIWKLIRLISWLTLFALFLKIFILPNYIAWWNSQEWTKILDVYVIHDKIHMWHLAAGLNALLALTGYYFYFDKADLYIKEEKWNEESVLKSLKIFTFLRGIISAYTITVGLLLTLYAISQAEWPSWSWLWIPPIFSGKWLP